MRTSRLLRASMVYWQHCSTTPSLSEACPRDKSWEFRSMRAKFLIFKDTEWAFAHPSPCEVGRVETTWLS